MGSVSSKTQGPDYPASRIDWCKANEFIRRLNEKEGVKAYRLPTGEEWEYACRAGGRELPFRDNLNQLGEYAWYQENSGGHIHPVGLKAPNAWGLYDMYGNVSEWCQDTVGFERLVRGGSISYKARYLNSKWRRYADFKSESLGFRVVIDKGESQHPAAKPPVREARDSVKSFTNSIGMDFVLIRKGTLLRTSSIPNCPPDRLEVQKDYYIATTEVTVAQFKRFIEATGYQTTAEKRGWSLANKTEFGKPKKVKGLDWRSVSGLNPVVHVSWLDAQAFIDWLNKKEGKKRYRLPTNLEWEHACRAGSPGKWCFGDDKGLLRQYAWYWFNSGGRAHEVARKKANAWGLYDMHGNVAEWCQDNDWGYFGKKNKAIRGGSWAAKRLGFYIENPGMCFDYGAPPMDDTSDNVGFRLVADAM
jgi:formylglycine-generating enzyme required for sulfatase activity